jgi:hypothetical protein
MPAQIESTTAVRHPPPCIVFVKSQSPRARDTARDLDVMDSSHGLVLGSDDPAHKTMETEQWETGIDAAIMP